MSLLDPTVGEVCDRMAVLWHKHQHATAAGKPADHYHDEHTRLASWLEGRFPDEPPPEAMTIALQLHRLHGKLWDVIERTAELERREVELTAEERKELARLCLQAYRLNRGRVRNKEEIDRICGCYQGPEKVTT